MNDKSKHISDCALQILKESGSATFSMTEIAEQANMELPAVLYYFKDKEVLLLALLNAFVEEYCSYLKAFRADDARHTDKALNQFLLNILEYRESDGCADLFKEFWAIALHNKEVRLVLDQYYRELYQIVFTQLLHITPEYCEKSKINHAVCFLLPFIEGYSLTRSTLPASVLQLTEQISKVVEEILLNR